MEIVLKYSIEFVYIILLYFNFISLFFVSFCSKVNEFDKKYSLSLYRCRVEDFLPRTLSEVVVVSLESRNSSRDAMLAATGATGKRKKHEKQIEIVFMHVCSYI